MPRRVNAIVPLLVAALALLLYGWTAAPGLTWANQGADGGDLLAAAMTNGVPHPPGYPLYMLLLQFWLWLTGTLSPTSDLAWRGNLFSALCAATSVGITVATAMRLLQELGKNLYAPLIAGLVGLGWAISPLLWSQATLTEVYGLHALFFSLLGYWAICQPNKQANYWFLLAVTTLGAAHHLTLLLLLPATLYLQWSKQRKRLSLYKDAVFAAKLVGIVAIGVGLAFGLHWRTGWVAAAGAPVNWGFATNWNDFWWLVSGQAYRGYLLGASAADTFDQIAAWAYSLTTQYTPLGLAIALAGLAYLDQEKPSLRNFSLLWLIPVSLYSILYYTRDSEIYLMPVGWLLAIWLTVGLAIIAEWLANWLAARQRLGMPMLGGLLLVALLGLLGWRWSQFSLRQDNEARQFLTQTAAIVVPGSIVISHGDEHTFALWYGAWASQELPADLIIVNDALYQFAWYRRLLAQQYPQVAGVDQSIELLIQQNKEQRAIFLADNIDIVAADDLTLVEPLWRIKSP